METEKQNLITLEEMIFDERRLVTYTTISKELCIHVNSSKSLLQTFIEKTKQKEPKIDLNINYIVSGLCDDNKALTTVCSESDIDSVKNKLKQVFYDHIYSVSTGSPKVDNVALMAINKFEDFPLCIGLIKSSSCSKRSTDEIGSLKTHSQNNVSTQPQKSSSFPGMTRTKTEKREAEKKENEASKTTTEQVKKVKSEPSLKSELKSPTKDPNGKMTTDSKTKLDSKSKNQKGIAGFFGKQTGTSNKNVVQKKEVPVINPEIDSKDDVKEVKMEIDDYSPTPPVVPEAKKIDTKTNAHKKEDNKKGKQQSNNKSLTQIKKTAKVDKKRKRVLHVSESESDDDKDPFVDVDDTAVQNHESDDEIPPTPTVNTVKVTSAMVNPKKRRKIIDKTYTDDEGYILTKKVEVYESCSENEEETAAKDNVVVKNKVEVKKETSPKENKKETKNSKKKISPPQKGKQATLMSFFKKM